MGSVFSLGAFQESDEDELDRGINSTDSSHAHLPSSSPSPCANPLLATSDDTLFHILCFLDADSLAVTTQVCKRLNQLRSSETLALRLLMDYTKQGERVEATQEAMDALLRDFKASIR